MKRISPFLLVFLLLPFVTIAFGQDKPEEPVGFDDLTLELYKKKKLFDKKSYPELRKAYAHDFEKDNASNIDRLWGGKEEPFRKFMDEHPAIKEMFFQAINPDKGGNDVPAALYLMKEIWEKHPNEFEKYPGLAVAVSLVWDSPQRGIHRSPIGQHKAVEGPNQADALTNFAYYSGAEKAMGDRIRYMPWEFTALLINHRTSLEERKWAMSKYLDKRKDIGKVYGTVPYDGRMLAGTAEPKLNGVEFTLPNQLFFGGVCTCQSDFSVRVAKSIGAPCFGNGGASRFGGGHAWITWIEIANISATGMQCSLKSEGRYFYDNYYVGGTYEPWNGNGITDRAFAMKLYSIGRDTTAYRQSVLVLRAFDRIAALEGFTARQKLDYLDKVINLNPLSTDAWRRITTMIRDGDFEKKDAGILKKYANRFFRDFAQHPDFTWEVFDDLISFEGWQKNRGENYGKLCAMYEQAKRPDLALRARLKYGKMLADEGRVAEAFKGLAGTCLLFPDEGAIIPGILNEMETLCQEADMEKTKANYRSLASFYMMFLPKITKKRGSSPSQYCIEMHERGIKIFEMIGDEAAVAHFRAELQSLNSSK